MKDLSLGFNFALCPKHIPVDEIISRMEQIAGMIKADGQLLREEVSRCLRKMRPITPTLEKEERKALANLKKDKDVLIMKANKGNATVLMNKVDYERKMTDLLQSDDYIKIRKDPMTIIEKRLRTSHRT